MTAVAALLIAQRPAFSGPTGGTVVDGSAGISQSGSVTNINQSSNKAIINWQGFSIGANETVNFNQPGSSSVTLNRVIGNETSVISGALNANGQVFIVNSAGVLFGKNAQVNVGGLVASTLDISNANFLAGNYVFSGNSQASIVNQGRIRAHDGGYVALLGKTVSNDGVISARLGTVAMASGSQITLNFGGDSLLDVTIDQGTLNALVENKRAIIANGGQVIMTAKAADAVLSAQVNNSGIIQARTMAALTGGSGKTRPAKTGSIKLIADGGTTNVSGKLDASAPKGGDGGFIETSGNKVKVADSAVITTKSATGKNGTWLIDPDGFTIAASGGDTTGAALSSRLATNGNVIINSKDGQGTDGNINVNDAVSWSTDSILTLNATNNININVPITATGTNAGLAMTYGGDYNILTLASYSGVTAAGVADQAPAGINYASVTLSGDHASLSINGTGYTLIHSMSDLAAITGPGNYALAQNLDASGTIYGGSVVSEFNGTLAGLGHAISNLSISNTVARSNTGLIGKADAGSTIRDIGLLNARVTEVGSSGTSNFGVGALVGVSAAANINHAYVDADSRISGGNPTGGLIGVDNGSPSTRTISDSYSAAAVIASNGGGLIGKASNVNVVRSHASGPVTGATANSGGLIGAATNVSVSDSYATGTVTGNSAALGLGGLIGNLTANTGGSIRNSYATGDVTGGYELGGLVGFLQVPGGDFTIDGSHASGVVSGFQSANSLTDQGIGGLVGNVKNTGTGTVYITNSYAEGAVGFFNPDKTTATFGEDAGGLVGFISGNAVIDNAVARGAVTGSLTGSGAGGLVGVDSTTTTIKNSHAFGAVSGNRSVGGLVGGNPGTITNSDASGNVTGYNAASSDNIGGLAGSNTGSITGSHASGTVTGNGPNASTGGLVGTNGGSIANSYFDGTVSGKALTGGSVGANFNNSGDPNNTTAGSITNSWYDSEKNPGLTVANTPACCNPGVVTGGGGLTTAQFADIKFYLNGTINQVLADRAAAAAAAAQFAQAASRTANTVASNAANSASTAPDPALSAAGTQATASSVSSKIDDNLKSIDDAAKAEDQRERRRVATATTARSSHPRARGGAGLGATIRSIDVDGQRFDLRGDGKKDAPGQKP
jgi:filamentous hemagglutinin family protein